jgi:two-component system cell cycle response regulator
MGHSIDDDTTVGEAFDPGSRPNHEHLSLLVLSGPDAGQWHNLAPTGGIVGRHPDVDVRLSDPAISRRHVEIIIADNGHIIVRDLDSRNGVHVHGQRITERRVSDGDQIQLSAESVLRVRFVGHAETALISELQRAATTDPLTGVANRRYLTGRLEQELSFAHRHKSPMSVLMIDLDHFKALNDAGGHQAGDLALREVAEALVETVRVEDVVARYGGDEFVIISRGYAPDAAAGLATRLRDAIRQLDIGASHGTPPLTLSIGIAGCDPQVPSATPLNIMELLARADAALYQAKRSGRDSQTVWSGTLDQREAFLGSSRPTMRIPYIEPED